MPSEPAQPAQFHWTYARLPSEQVGGHQPPTIPNSVTATSDPDPNPIMSSQLSAKQSKPDSQSSVDSNFPAWTALATTSDEEDGLCSDSQATTPEPDDKPSDGGNARRPPRGGQRIGRSSELKASRGAFNPTQPFAVVRSTSGNAATTPSRPSNSMPLLWLPPPGPSSVASPPRSPLKRKPTQSPPDALGKPREKQRKHAPSANIIRIPPVKLHTDLTSPPRIKLVYSKFMAENAAQAARDYATSPGHNGEAERATSDSASGAPPRHVRLQKQQLPTDNASSAEGMLVDDALDTHTSAIRVLPQYAHPAIGYASDVVRLHVALRSFPSGSVDKGKRRAHSSWSIPRWSKAGEFKERLDAFYGPGDINRGLGKGPANTKSPSADEDVFVTAPDGAVPRDQFDVAAASGTALTEDEDDADARPQGMRRGRLENPSPGKVTRTSQRPPTRNNSPEIV
ncbi:hypothetical protein C8T65DRAFT_172852 [Cerioporus squamosus]|nr:hypothetical protein C8T65DRAFT_172852 [Cerioporus squamosus]